VFAIRVNKLELHIAQLITQSTLRLILIGEILRRLLKIEDLTILLIRFIILKGLSPVKGHLNISNIFLHF